MQTGAIRSSPARSAARATAPSMQSRMLRSRTARAGARLGRAADAEQLIEHHARVANHRQRLGPASAQLMESV